MRHQSCKAGFRADWWATVLVHNAALTAWVFRDWLASHGVLLA
ncbi:MAG: hypothetical protein Q7T70_05735 [Polaromonas sp.]|nr:hypothetical protein [Polaromonas sp.]